MNFSSSGRDLCRNKEQMKPIASRKLKSNILIILK
jgi:hypothetical protein